MQFNSNEELRQLLRTADKKKDTLNKVDSKRGFEVSEEATELANLIGSLDIGLNKLPNKEKPSKYYDDNNNENQDSLDASLNSRWKDASYDTDDSIRDADTDYLLQNDTEDYSVVKFGSSCMLKGKLGLYMTANIDDGQNSGSTSTVNASSMISATNSTSGFLNSSFASNNGQSQFASHLNSRSYPLGLDGQGVGDVMDCLSFINVQTKDDTSAVRYGMTVAIKVTAAKERYLGLKEGSKLGFWRNLVGQGEKWLILKAATTIGVQSSNTANGSNNSSYSISGINSGDSNSCEDMQSRGKYVRIGDAILIQTVKSDHLLGLHEVPGTSTYSAAAMGGGSVEPRLVYRERAGRMLLGVLDVIWQLEQFGSVGLPAWYTNRPYLSGQYLVMSPEAKTPSSDVQARAFPQAVNILQQKQKQSVTPHRLSSPSSSDLFTLSEKRLTASSMTSPAPLNTFPVMKQHSLLIRDLLQVLAGIEGQYIRAAAATSNSNNNNSTTSNNNHRTSSSSYNDYTDTTTPTNATTIPVNKPSGTLFMIDLDSADRSAANQVIQLLPVCESAIRIREFIRLHARFEYGLSSHALCAALKQIIREFDILVAQLEHLFSTDKLTMQKLVYLLQPSKITLRVLDQLCAQLKDTVGGALIDKLHSCMLSQGDMKARQLHLHLLTKASEPFIDTLSTWLFRGELQDAYHEFMIIEDKSLSREALEEDFNARYWDNRYTLCEKHIPMILRNHAVRALTAGKYLSVVKDCCGVVIVVKSDTTTTTSKKNNGSSISNYKTAVIYTVDNNNFSSSNNDTIDNNNNNISSSSSSNNTNTSSSLILPVQKKLHLSLEVTDNNLSQAIEEAYVLSSRALLKVLDSKGLRTHLQSLRRFFLLEHGDFFTQFMDSAEMELRREVKEVALSRLQGLLQMAVLTSTLVNDLHKEELSCTLASHNLIQHLHLIQNAGEDPVSDSNSNNNSFSMNPSQGLKGIEAFTLDYKVGWPLSIVLSRRAITKYQLLSRLLYFSKHVERRVLMSWMGHQNTKELNVRGAMGPSYCLRHRMLHFLQNFVYYMTLEVIGPRGHELERQLNAAEDLDEVMELHERFLDTCLKECLLASQDLLKILTKIMTTCLLFADQMQRFSLDGSINISNNNNNNSNDSDNIMRSSGSGLRRSYKGNDTTSGGDAAAELTQSLHLRQSRMRNSAEFIQRETSHESFVRILHKFTDTFDTQLKEFLDKLWTNTYRHHVQLNNLCVRLDYNGFYSSQFAENY